VNPATRLAHLTVHALARAGVGHVVLCPGSRSAPLAYALAGRIRPDLTLHVRHDERVAAFTALGAGLAGTTIGAVVTTSGTAAANLHPAVLEAHHANRPLVVVTADRPPTLRGTWANQTSELQAGVFGDAVRARLDLDDAAAVAGSRGVLGELVTTMLAATGRPSGRPGPVHLNLGFTEPLLPDHGPDDGPDDGRIGAVTVEEVPEPDPAPEQPLLELTPGPRTVVVAGDGAGAVAREFAEAAGLPLLAEPSSLARGGPNAVGPYRLLLDLPTLGGAVERVVAFGRPTLSRPVTRLLQRPDVEVVLVSPYPGWPDPGRAVTRCSRIVVDAPAPRPWLDRWRAAGAAAAAAIDGVLDGDALADRLTGPLLARELWAALRPGEHLVAGSSNPIRDLDLAAHPASGSGPHVVAGRGLAGIDGTLSTATGLALAAGPTRVLVGDVTFLHDVGALLVGPADRRPDLQVVVLNDDGGGIFGLLEYGERAQAGPAAARTFDRLFGTPHAADLSALCRGYDVRHEAVKDLTRLREALAEPRPGTGVVEVRADRWGLRDLHARLGAAARAAALTALGTAEQHPV
jgi:2-succinyl-5-enolpyruvyl-6-hydroxy-3-cyclohexene-1-carboxylate synthase